MRTEKQTTYFRDLIAKGPGTSGGGAVTAGTGVSATIDQLRMPRFLRLTLASFAIAIAEADDFGGTKLLDLPDSNLLLLGAEINLELTKGGEVGGLVAATDITVGVGTAVASNSTLSSTMVDIFTGVALTATDLTPALAIHSQEDATVAYPHEIADGAASALYLNLAAAITADDVLTADGTIDLYFVDIGNATS